MRYKRDFLETFSKLIKRNGLQEHVLVSLKGLWVALAWNSAPSFDRVGPEAWRGDVFSREFSVKANIITKLMMRVTL